MYPTTFPIHHFYQLLIHLNPTTIHTTYIQFHNIQHSSLSPIEKMKLYIFKIYGHIFLNYTNVNQES